MGLASDIVLWHNMDNKEATATSSQNVSGPWHLKLDIYVLIDSFFNGYGAGGRLIYIVPLNALLWFMC